MAESPSVSATVPVVVRKIVVTAEPKMATVQPGEALHVSAAVAGGFPDDFGSPSVIWSATGGTVDNGIYTAPTSAGLYVLRATNFQDTRKYDEVVVQVGGTVACYLAPREIRLKVGQTQQFQALVFGTDNKDVYWSTNGGGYIKQNGVFEATEPADCSVSIMSAEDPSKVGTATVHVVAAKEGSK